MKPCKLAQWTPQPQQLCAVPHPWMLQCHLHLMRYLWRYMITNRTRVRHVVNIATDCYIAAFVLYRNHDHYASAGCPINWYPVQSFSSTSIKEAAMQR